MSVLLVVGMHRSGTSALCAALRACGASFGDRLLDPLAGVNDEGFWEDAEVVECNERLLAAAGGSWYAPGDAVLGGDWPAAALADFRADAQRILGRGFGSPDSLWAIKDPRFCLTLPLWLEACQRAGLTPRVCYASRAPREVARSLLRRDGFPEGYCLRLDLDYRRSALAALPGDVLRVDYPDLLASPQAVMANFADELSLQVDEAALAQSVRTELRHQRVDSSNRLLDRADIDRDDLDALAATIEVEYPLDGVLRELLDALVARGRELSAIGESHSQALATIAVKDGDIDRLAGELDQALAVIAGKDRDIEGLATEHRQALATLDERDAQIRELDRRLAEIGAMHSHALEVIAGKDAEIQALQARIEAFYQLPVLGGILRLGRWWRQRRLAGSEG